MHCYCSSLWTHLCIPFDIKINVTYRYRNFMDHIQGYVSDDSDGDQLEANVALNDQPNRDADSGEDEAEQTSFDDNVPDLGNNVSRQVYLITYSKENGVYSKESFAELVVDKFRASGNAEVMQWACSKERHKDGSHHFHMVVKLDRKKRFVN